jgi:hypothetical protein
MGALQAAILRSLLLAVLATVVIMLGLPAVLALGAAPLV